MPSISIFFLGTSGGDRCCYKKMAIFHVSGMRVLDDVGIMETGEQKFLKSLCVLRMQIILRY